MTFRVTMTEAAEARLREILDWTETRFGPMQTDRYRDTLLSRFDALAAGTAHCRTCDLLTGLPEDAALEMTRAGEHVIVFRRAPDEIRIVDFLHARSDIPAQIQRITETDID